MCNKFNKFNKNIKFKKKRKSGKRKKREQKEKNDIIKLFLLISIKLINVQLSIINISLNC